MINNEKPPQKDALIVLILLVVAGFGACNIFKGSDSQSSSDCFDRVGQEMAKRESGKVVGGSDIDRYYNELTSRCR